ncbi:MAG: hypothetical protein DRP06_03190 [Candidatus Aenigmatarchaeota archaeon]|nr:MAG: hypothetical protein DRP06_03190 [Candidatus Aenigmarchaeota archaeon]
MEPLNLFWVVLLTFLPTLELRASIPYALLILEMNPLIAFLIIILANIVLGEIIFYSLHTILPHVLRIELLERIYNKCIKRIQKKIHKNVDKYGTMGLALFIGVPLPGSGVWTGALAAFLLGFERKEFSKANIIGVLIAGVVVTFVVVAGINGFSLFVKS